MRKLFILLAFLQTYCYAQTPEMPAYVPMSPNAAALGMYGSIPVGHYTGVPNIAIPLYEIELDGKKFPISISYHASGIKVMQEASTVGLGWVLNAGGCITQEVRGWADFNSFPLGYYLDTNMPIPGENNGILTKLSNSEMIAQINKYSAYRDNARDGEADLFHFNFGSFSGTCFFAKRDAPGNSYGSAKAIIRNQKDALDIKYILGSGVNNTTDRWEITDSDGFKYYFGTNEMTMSYVADRYRPNRDSFFNPRTHQNNIPVSWHLDSIVSPNNNKITFEYEKDNIYTQISYMEEAYGPVGILNWLAGTYNVSNDRPVFQPQAVYTYHSSYSKNEQVLIKKITTGNGKITINYSGREDIESTDANKKARKISGIVVENNNEQLHNIVFLYSYNDANPTPKNARLLLDSLWIDDLSYGFTYNQSHSLPKKMEHLADYWGYYNSNSGYGIPVPFGNFSAMEGEFRLAPPVGTINEDGRKTFYNGNDRQPNETFMKYGILTSITYPTRGKTTFDFEVNRYSNGFDAYEEGSSIQSTSFASDGGSILDETGDDFYVDESNTGFFMDMMVSLSYFQYVSQNHRVTVYLEKKLPDNTYQPLFAHYLDINIYDYDFQRTQEMNNASLVRFETPGYYRIRIADARVAYDPYIFISFLGSNKNFITKKVTSGGGLRIKSMRDYADNNNFVQHDFKYEKEDVSSGLLMTIPDYNNLMIFSHTLAYENFDFSFADALLAYIPFAFFRSRPSQLLPIDTYEIFYEYLNYCSYPTTPFSNSANGNAVGYSYVEEKITTSSNQNSRIAYNFHNQADSLVPIWTGYMKGYPPIPDLRNGNVLQIEYFNNSNNVVRKEKFVYNKVNSTNIKGVKVFTMPWPSYDMLVKFYDLSSEHWVQSQKTVSDFVNGNEIKTITDYTYNTANWLPSKEKNTLNTNETVEKNIKYPVDFATIEPYKTMVSKHIISPVIEQESKKNNTRLQTVKTDYKNWGNNIFAPEYVQVKNSLQTNFEPRITYHNYDSHGNPLYITKDNINKVVYLWSYGHQYPIAKIENATYAEVKAALGYNDAQIESFAARYPTANEINAIGVTLNTLSKAMVTTYTYKPLVGILTSTDPRGITTYYDYDDFGRLKEVYYYENGNKRKVEGYEYHYK